ncbi:pre-rRNA-processing protein Pno1 [Malassezia pachydermatis]|uniref:Pre-rRNA-processing protein PNO1 n=1 Tax=Malassezia pachydermatis TaxID=77020 RepID=A0A0M9VMW7_9BASI|nr:pre-rrna-processing protein pno1 [Malassezia pachydermatis]KOS12719.1 pre-rrna-processing protein pno1 [Malassezia pachydermatis]
MGKQVAKASTSGEKRKAKHTSKAVPKEAEDEDMPSSSLPARKPLGQENSDDELEDDEIMSSLQAEASGADQDDDALVIDQDMAEDDTNAPTQGMQLDQDDSLQFKPISASALAAAQSGVDNKAKSQLRKIPVPPHRMSPLKRDWPKIYTPLVEQAGLMVRMNPRTRCVEIKSSKHTEDLGVLQKASDFVKAYTLGFDADDALALLRLDDLYVDSFEMKDVKTLHGDHLSRAIGRIAGKDGRTRFAIENASRTRIVLADTKIHILGAYQNIRIAKDSIVALIMGSPPGKVYAKLRTISARMRQRA